MCGIVGYIGSRQAQDFLLEGLRRLEYRGYDSAGMASLTDSGEVRCVKSVGRIESLSENLKSHPTPGSIGIGHTRWATHGSPTLENAHPHVGGDGDVMVVHNGVIENYRGLKMQLAAEGYVFRSETDSEVIAHLITKYLREQTTPESEAKGHEHLIAAVTLALAQIRGAYGLTVMFRGHADLLIAARLGSPLVIGVGDGEHFIASDPTPLAGYTERIVYLADHQMALVTADRLEVVHRDQGQIKHDIKVLDVVAEDVGLGGFPHYMLKEIFEQPESLRNTMRGRLNDDDATAIFGGLNLTRGELRSAKRLVLTACGTSWHSALVGEYMIESMARLPVEVEYASELRYRNPPIEDDTLFFAISQSGETADTRAAMAEVQRKGHPTLAICNVVGSTIAQESDGGIYLHAGPEIGVASTKAFTSQCLVQAMLGLYFGRLHHLSYDAGRRVIEALQALPDQVAEALDSNDQARVIAEKYGHATNFLYLGRQYNFPTALEGALKLKEISYLHAEGYPAAEMKHGPIALVDEHTPSVIIVPRGFVYDKVLSNLEEIKARGGPVIAVVEKGDARVAELADEIIEVPAVTEFLQPLVSIIPLQLLAYHIAVLRGCDVDKPRNLAKSVTVE